jgi:hypothetical protein
MSFGHRIASAALFGVLGLVWYASLHGWGLRSEADVLAQGQGRVRTGSLHARHFYGGGPRYGK